MAFHLDLRGNSRLLQKFMGGGKRLRSPVALEVSSFNLRPLLLFCPCSSARFFCIERSQLAILLSCLVSTVFFARSSSLFSPFTNRLLSRQSSRERFFFGRSLSQGQQESSRDSTNLRILFRLREARVDGEWDARWRRKLFDETDARIRIEYQWDYSISDRPISFGIQGYPRMFSYQNSYIDYFTIVPGGNEISGIFFAIELDLFFFFWLELRFEWDTRFRVISFVLNYATSNFNPSRLSTLSTDPDADFLCQLIRFEVESFFNFLTTFRQASNAFFCFLNKLQCFCQTECWIPCNGVNTLTVSKSLQSWSCMK